jgi:hypothetical protein
MRGAYRDAADEYREYGGDSPMYREYIAAPGYVAYYDRAVQLSAAYVAALFEVYATLAAGEDFTKAKKKRFESVVRDADLSCPLQGSILETARRELTRKVAGRAKYKPCSRPPEGGDD